VINAPSDGNNSLFVNMDAEPVAPGMIWDIPITSGFERRVCSWRGIGTDTANQFSPQIFQLSAGSHTLIVRGRESGVQVDRIELTKVNAPAAPTNLRLAQAF